MGPSGHFRLTSAMFKENSKILGTLRCGGTKHSCLAPSLPGLSNKEKGWARQFSHAWPPSCNPLATVPALSLDGWSASTQDSCGGVTRMAGDVAGVCAEGQWVAELGLGCGFLSFLGSVDMLHLYQDCWGSLSAQQRSPSSLTDGVSCSFIWGGFPWACIHPVCIPKRPLLFLLLPAPLLPFWPCCQRPLVLGWLRGRAWPLQASQVLQVSLGHSWACLWGKEERKGTLLEVLPEKPFLLADAQPTHLPLLSSLFPQAEQCFCPQMKVNLKASWRKRSEQPSASSFCPYRVISWLSQSQGPCRKPMSPGDQTPQPVPQPVSTVLLLFLLTTVPTC